MASSSNDLAVRHRGTGIAIVTTVGCPYCKKAKDALGKHNLQFDEIELTRDLELLRRIKETTKQSTVPQVIHLSYGLMPLTFMSFRCDLPSLWPQHRRSGRCSWEVSSSGVRQSWSPSLRRGNWMMCWRSAEGVPLCQRI